MFFSLAYMQFLGLAECAETMQRLPVFYKQKFNLIFPGARRLSLYHKHFVQLSCLPCWPVFAYSRKASYGSADCARSSVFKRAVHQHPCGRASAWQRPSQKWKVIIINPLTFQSWECILLLIACCVGWAYAIPFAIIRIPITLIEVTFWSIVVYWVTGLETEPGRCVFAFAFCTCFLRLACFSLCSLRCLPLPHLRLCCAHAYHGIPRYAALQCLVLLPASSAA